jgi:hypothetical protein
MRLDPLDEVKGDLEFLLRQMDRGDVVLFAGAGFSSDARNAGGIPPPGRPELINVLCDHCAWSSADQDLPTVFGQAERHLGTKRFRELLRSLYLGCSVNGWYTILSEICWHRIFTTNIDDVLEACFQLDGAQQRLQSVTMPAPMVEPDITMQELVCVHLHGFAAEPGKSMIFTRDQFGDITAAPEPWYQALVDDMQSRSVIFVGSGLSDPPLYHYLSLRSKRGGAGAEDARAKAYVVDPMLTDLRARDLRDRSMVPCNATGEAFFERLKAMRGGALPRRMEVVRTRLPHLVAEIEASSAPLAVLRQFDVILPDRLPGARPGRSFFYMGAEPQWSDIAGAVDAQRGCVTSLMEAIASQREPVSCVVVSGYAGSGKSALLMRAACEAARAGETVYYFRSDDIVELAVLHQIARGLAGRRALIFVDRAAGHFGVLGQFAEACAVDGQLVFVLADRTHLGHAKRYLLGGARISDFAMPDLDRHDVEAILVQLERHGFLGALQGLSHERRVDAFMVRARRQLLVALREATFGKGFDAILVDEFQSLESDAARLAYTIVALGTSYGSPGVRRRHLLSCLDGSDEVRARILRDQLRDVVLPSGASGSLLAPRHRLIGEFVAEETAPQAMRREGVVRLLTALAGDVTLETIRRRTPDYLAYRGLTNSEHLRILLGNDYDILVGVFEAVKPLYRHDFLFWLQYGCLELEHNKFELAEKNLQQSLGIQPKSYQTLHYFGVLKLKKAIVLGPSAERISEAEEGERLLLEQIRERGAYDPYPYAAYLHYKLEYLRVVRGVGHRTRLEELYRLAKKAKEAHPLDRRVKEAAVNVQKEYLMGPVKNR